MRDILFDSNGLLRSGWRFAIFCVLFIFAAMVSRGVALTIFRTLSVRTENGDAGYLLLNGIAMLIPALLIGWLCGKYLEHLPFRALGAWFTEGWLKHLIVGILFGAGTLGLAVLIACAAGGLRFEVNSIDSSALINSLVLSFVVLAVGAAAEEALFRGYILQTFARSGLAALAIAMTSIFFGAVHAGNPNASAFAVINTMLAGVWFGIGYMKTRDLWFVWGMHLMWNWMLGAVFGIEVSGLTTLASAPLLREIDTGPAWLTGESYGIEGGVVTTIALLVSTITVYYLPFLKPADEMVKLHGLTPTSSSEPQDAKAHA